MGKNTKEGKSAKGRAIGLAGQPSAVILKIRAKVSAEQTSANPKPPNGYSFSSKIRHSLGGGGRGEGWMRANHFIFAIPPNHATLGL
jgi:hypothetical protein